MQRRVRVLAIEDSATQAAQLRHILEQAGYEAVMAANGQDGLERFAELPFDLVITDIVMPGPSGYDVCRQIKQSERGAAVPVILLTSLRDPMDILRGLECGADNFVTKPYEAEYLEARVRSILETRAMRTGEEGRTGVPVSFLGQHLAIDSNPAQILDFLLSTYEDFARAKQAEHDHKLEEERQRLEAQSLRVSQAALQASLDALSAGIAVVDERGEIVAVNSVWTAMLAEGRVPLGEDCLVGAEYAERCRAVTGEAGGAMRAIARAMREVQGGGRESFQLELLCPCKGELAWLLVRGRVFEIDGSKQIVLSHEDITERKQAEQRQALQFEVTRALSRAGGAAEAAVGLLAAVCRRVGWSIGELWVVQPSGERMRRVAAWQDEPVEQGAPDAGELEEPELQAGEGVAGAGWARARPLWWDSDSEEEEAAGLQGGIALPEGVRPALALPVRLGHDVGAVLCFTTRIRRRPPVEVRRVVEDIAQHFGQFLERQRAVEELRASEERFRELAENIREVFWIRSPSTHRFLYVSPAVESLLGVAAEELLREPEGWRNAVHPQDRQRFDEALRRLGTGRTEEAYRVVRTDEQERWVRDRAFPVLDERGEIYRVVGIAEDITEEREAEEALRRSEEQLHHAQKMEAVGRLAGGIAHDFNNLLLAIIGFADLAMAVAPPGSRAAGYNAEIKKAGDRAASLTRQLLAFSRKEVLRLEPVDLNMVVGDLERMLRRLLGSDVLIETERTDGLLPVRADRGRLEQIIVNLCVNARDAMPGGGKLTIGTRNVRLGGAAASRLGAAPGDYVVIAVADTGTGMTPDVQAHVFEPFFTTKEQGKGTGLGLSTVYGIVRQLGGHIDLVSALGKGTTFRIYLPKGTDGNGQALEQGPNPTVPGTAGSETVLLVEDEPIVRELMNEVLLEHGYQVLQAEHPREALELARDHGGPIDLMITDVVMPELSGTELAARLLSQRPALRILFISGYPDAAFEQPGSPKGKAVDYLDKPFTAQALVRKARDLLDRAVG